MRLPSPNKIASAVRHRILRPAYWNRVLLPRLRSTDEHRLMGQFGWPKGRDELVDHLHARPSRFFFGPRNRKDFFLNVLTSLQPMDSIADEADLVLENKFQTLGSPLTALGESIPWHRDFKSGKEWEVRPPKELDILDLSNPSDVKVPWELSRFHQVWWLGKASWVTGNSQYARKFESLMNDWIDKNPVGLGVNWCVAMEAAIRACNWIAGYYFFRDAPSISPDFWARFAGILFVHGLFIEHHLEYARVNGNHFLSDVTGLLFLGFFFSDTPAGQRWLRWSLHQLETQMNEQVYDDGVNHEKSTSYHRLVLELFTASAVLCKLNARPLSPAFLERLKRMYEFMQAYTRPDGTVPLIGDADDGRLFRHSVHQDVNDHRSLLCAGSILFERGDFKDSSGSFSQDALWYFGGEGFELFQRLPTSKRMRTSVAFPSGGFYCLQTNEIHVFVDAGDIGMRGRGGHGHNDTFSFELWARGEPLIVDSGTYAYTFDVTARNQFRSTPAHNTALIDTKELAEFRELWSIVDDRTNPEILEWVSNTDRDVLEARHHAYESLASPVVVRRRFEFDKNRMSLKISDSFEGTGDHHIDLFFHLAPGSTPELRGERAALIHARSLTWAMTSDAGLFSVMETKFSRSYGVQEPNPTLHLQFAPTLPVVLTTIINLEFSETS